MSFFLNLCTYLILTYDLKIENIIISTTLLPPQATILSLSDLTIKALACPVAPELTAEEAIIFFT